MSDLRLPSTPLPANATPVAAPAAMRSAQAAFFRAALDQAAPQATPQRTETATTSQAETPRTPRPGALLDIRV